MKEIDINAIFSPDEADIKIIEDGITRHNDSKVGKQINIPVGSFARLNGKTIGGISGNLFWNYLYIDIMWIDDDKIVYIVENASLPRGDNIPSYMPVVPANKVLEVNAGFVKKNNIKLGDITKD